MSQNLALALLLTSTATGLSERAGDYGLRVTATSPRIPRPCPDGDGPAGCGPSIGARQCVLDGQAVAVAAELVDARLQASWDSES
ncbi:hypothetical protein [Streptomyces sp. NPDC090053]|uniref:hypothetical protein n=1 Tax=Streptomyces sp. NPDC090053 TaxID=3365932 RepID=UPI003823599D